jgi:hypothetical protein
MVLDPKWEEFCELVREKKKKNREGKQTALLVTDSMEMAATLVDIIEAETEEERPYPGSFFKVEVGDIISMNLLSLIRVGQMEYQRRTLYSGVGIQTGNSRRSIGNFRR